MKTGRQYWRAPLLLLVMGLAACTERYVVNDDDGGPPDLLNPADDLIGRDWVNPSATNFIYLVNDDGVLLRFDPLKRKTSTVGRIKCNGGYINAHSMSVDRYGVAWVNYSPDQLVRVNTRTAGCQKTGYQAPLGFGVFGMGFAPAGPGSTSERLFVSSSVYTPGPSSQLARIAPATQKLTVIGSLPAAERSPELTGTRNGNLYGYFPGKADTFIAQLGQKTAKALKTWKLPPLGHDVGAWAFAHWGGRFYQFISKPTGKSKVIRYDPTTGKNIVIVQNLGHRIVGAGVSAKAPGAANDLGI